MQNPPISNLFFPYLTYLEGEIELQCEGDYGITNLERCNGFLMLMRNSELVPLPTRRESILFAQIPRKWNRFTLKICLFTLLMTFYSEASCFDLTATPAVRLMAFKHMYWLIIPEVCTPVIIQYFIQQTRSVLPTQCSSSTGQFVLESSHVELCSSTSVRCTHLRTHTHTHTLMATKFSRG